MNTMAFCLLHELHTIWHYNINWFMGWTSSIQLDIYNINLQTFTGAPMRGGGVATDRAWVPISSEQNIEGY